MTVLALVAAWVTGAVRPAVGLVGAGQADGLVRTPGPERWTVLRPVVVEGPVQPLPGC